MKDILSNINKFADKFGLAVAGEAMGKGVYEFTHNFFKKKVEDKQEFVKNLEKDRPRVVAAILELGKNQSNKLWLFHERACNGELKQLDGKPIKEDNFVFLLTQLEPARLKDTLRELNKLSEEDLLQIIQFLDQDEWGDRWYKLKKSVKSFFNIISCHFRPHGNMLKAWKKWHKTIKRKASKAEKELERETKNSQRRFERKLGELK